jgi:hypothetical protein
MGVRENILGWDGEVNKASMKLKTTPLDLAQTPILRFHFPKHQNS